MGDVYEASDERLRRPVAVKRFRAGPSSDPARFDAEIQLLASLDHPGIVRVYDAGQHDGDAYLVLELIDGPTLAETVGRGPTAPAAVAQLGIAVAEALAYLHERGVVHRDVTPANILCGSDGRPRLADFGIARLLDSSRLTATATTVGTAAYMAPEQVQGHEVTGAADVYALGLVLLELLTGRQAFEGTMHEVAVARLARPPDTTTDVPGPWRALLQAMTDRAAPNRPSAADVRQRLDEVLVAIERTDEATGATPAVVVGAGAAATAAEDDPFEATAAVGTDASTGAVGASPPGPSVVVGAGAAAVSPDLVTRAVPVVDGTRAVPPGGTQVMPVDLAPAEPEPSRTAPVIGALAGALWARRRLVAVLGGLALLVLVAVAAAGGGGDLEIPPPSTAPAAEAPTTTVAPSTTAPPPTTTEAPPADAGGRGDGKGKGEEKGDGKKGDEEGDD